MGGFRLYDQHGHPIEIASKKGRLLLAMLAIAESGERSRLWLQEKLWSRGSAQDSLRRELASLRGIFKPTGFDPLPRSVPRDIVRLQLDCFDVDITPLTGGIFLDGLTVARDEIIEEWLADAMMPDMTRMPIHAGTSAELSISVDETISGVFLNIKLVESHTRRVLCSRRCEIEIGKAGEACTPEYSAKKFIAESVDEILFSIVRMEQSRSDEVTSVVRLIHEGVDGMFQLSDVGLDRARDRFDMAIDQMPDSITHAWRAYLCTQLIDDARITDENSLRSEARWHAAKALELDRFNPLTRSLLTHVYSFALHEFDTAAELIQMANELSSDHLMTFDADALLQLYMGKLDGSRVSALQASGRQCKTEQ